MYFRGIKSAFEFTERTADRSDDANRFPYSAAAYAHRAQKRRKRMVLTSDYSVNPMYTGCKKLMRRIE